ncbi:MAG: transcriptional repressor [Thiobacillaceae bacterium]|nr:transcriptional repressor [Thiobacillaceae bacterium]MCX7673151.1 transcriptional repressor [Thiobacillaceae bacterium]MDW8322892.1 transcriptional repressor [Burkholderiales bacterium]
MSTAPALTADAIERARQWVAERGRTTPARVRVLAHLLQAGRALTHAELEAGLARAGGLDRVTLYRVLDWLVQQGLAHRIAGEDRVWRFSAVDSGAGGHDHAHFRCDDCGRVYCLDSLRPVVALTLPAGFRCREAELTLHGLCPQCGA